MTAARSVNHNWNRPTESEPIYCEPCRQDKLDELGYADDAGNWAARQP